MHRERPAQGGSPARGQGLSPLQASSAVSATHPAPAPRRLHPIRLSGALRARSPSWVGAGVADPKPPDRPTTWSQDLIVHVRDVSHPETELQKDSVLSALRGLRLPAVLLDNVLEVHNKVDLVPG